MIAILKLMGFFIAGIFIWMAAKYANEGDMETETIIALAIGSWAFLVSILLH